MSATFDVLSIFPGDIFSFYLAGLLLEHNLWWCPCTLSECRWNGQRRQWEDRLLYGDNQRGYRIHIRRTNSRDITVTEGPWQRQRSRILGQLRRHASGFNLYHLRLPDRVRPLSMLKVHRLELNFKSSQKPETAYWAQQRFTSLTIRLDAPWKRWC